MTDMNEKKGSSFGRALKIFLIALFKFLLGVLALGLVGLIVYFGVIYLYREIIYPIQTNQYKLDDLEATMKTNQDLVNERLSDFNDRLTGLESQNDVNAERFAQFESDLGVAQESLEAQDETLNTLDGLEKSLDQLDGRIAALEEMLAETPVPEEGPEMAEAAEVVALRVDVGVLKTMSFLSRSRAYLIQKNYDLATVDAENALTALEGIMLDLPEEKAGAAEGLVERIRLALENLPDNPVLAAEDLEIAWRTLVDDLAIPASMEAEVDLDVLGPEEVESSTMEAESVLELTVTPTPTPFQSPTLSPTPTPIS